MKKRIIALTLTIAMLFTLITAIPVSATGEEIGITVSNTNPQIGDIVTATLYIKNFESLSTIQAAVGWNPAVLTPWHKSLDRSAITGIEFLDEPILRLTQYNYELEDDVPVFVRISPVLNIVTGVVGFCYETDFIQNSSFLPYDVPQPSVNLEIVKMRFKVISNGDANLGFRLMYPESQIPEDNIKYIIEKEPGAQQFDNFSGVIENVPTLTIGSPIPQFTAAQSATPKSTDITVTNGEPGMTYSYAFSGSTTIPETGWSAYTDALTAIDVPRGGNNRYIFLKSKTAGGTESASSAGYDLTGKVSQPDGPPATNNRPSDPANPLNIKFSWTASSNQTLGIPFAMDMGLTPLDAYRDEQHFNYCKGTFDVGYTSSPVPYDTMTGVVDQNNGLSVTWYTGSDYEGVTTSGDYADTPINDANSDGIYGRLPFYIAWNARCPVLRYSADGVIPPSKPTYYSNDLNSGNFPSDRYSLFGQTFGKYDLLSTGTNTYEFTSQSTFMKWMRYVVWVDRDLSEDTTYDSPSKYAWSPSVSQQPGADASKTNKGQLFRNYAITKIAADSSNVFYTDANGKPWADQACTQPFDVQLTGSSNQQIYIAPVNTQVGSGGNPISTEGGNVNNYGIYFIAKNSSPYADCEVEFGGAGIQTSFIIGIPPNETTIQYPCQNIVQRDILNYPPPPPPIELIGVPPTSYGASDGKILGTTSEMEYRIGSSSTYYPCGEGQTTGLIAGDYYVRFAAKPGYAPSTETLIVLSCGPDSRTLIHGYVQYSGVTVTIEGESTLSDINGYFQIEKVLTPGTYNLTFTKSGIITRTIPVTVSSYGSDIEISLPLNKITLILGDTNNDGSINVTDIGHIKSHFGTYIGHPNYDPGCDLDSDGAINITDLNMCKGNFNKSCSSYPVWVK